MLRKISSGFREFSYLNKMNHLSWDSPIAFAKSLNNYRTTLFMQRDLLLHQSNHRFKEFGGDPLSTEWSNFRPLRLSREEDWSDWLAYFIETNQHPYFNSLLFNDTKYLHLT